jgi:hypothetical protein
MGLPAYTISDELLQKLPAALQALSANVRVVEPPSAESRVGITDRFLCELEGGGVVEIAVRKSKFDPPTPHLLTIRPFTQSLLHSMRQDQFIRKARKMLKNEGAVWP